MFTNCLANVFLKCQRAVRAQTLYSDSRFPRSLNERLNSAASKRDPSVRIVNIIELEKMTTIARQKLIKLSLFKKQSVIIEVLKQHMVLHKIPEMLKQHMVLHKIPEMLKKHSVNTLRLWAQQCEYVLAQRIRRGQQIFSLYSKIWEEKALKEIVGHLSRRGRDVLIASCVAAIFDWDVERISDDVMNKHMGDIEYVYKLQETTMTCSNCGLRLLIDKAFSNIKYCNCPKKTVSRQRTDHLAEWEESNIAPEHKPTKAAR